MPLISSLARHHDGRFSGPLRPFPPLGPRFRAVSAGHARWRLAPLLQWSACLAAVVGAPACVQAADGVTIYGRINIAAERTSLGSSGTGAISRLSNNRSVIGFRGVEELGDGPRLLWQLEGSLAPDTGVGSFTSRDTRVGLAGAWGTAFAGVWTLPYTTATSSFDPFYPTTAGYMALMGNGSAPSTDNVINTSAFDRRQRNVVQYWSPSIHGVTARLAYAFNEETVAATGAHPSLVSMSVISELGDWLVTAAHEVHRAYNAADGSDTGSKMGLSYKTGPVRLAAVVERLRYETASGVRTRDAAYVSATWKLGASGLLAGYAKASNGGGTAAETVGFIAPGPRTGATQLTVGADHSLSPRTALFVYYSRIANAEDAAYDFAINGVNPAQGQRPAVFSRGMRHAF